MPPRNSCHKKKGSRKTAGVECSPRKKKSKKKTNNNDNKARDSLLILAFLRSFYRRAARYLNRVLYFVIVLSEANRRRGLTFIIPRQGISLWRIAGLIEPFREAHQKMVLSSCLRASSSLPSYFGRVSRARTLATCLETRLLYRGHYVIALLNALGSRNDCPSFVVVMKFLR